MLRILLIPFLFRDKNPVIIFLQLLFSQSSAVKRDFLRRWFFFLACFVLFCFFFYFIFYFVETLRCVVVVREFKIYDATVAKTSFKIASSSFSIYFAIMSVCLTFES